jgi:hypothetical protein
MWPPPELIAASKLELLSYLLGAYHDGTYNKTHRTFRISQREREWVEMLASIIQRLGYRAWVYPEGNRGVHVVETCFSILSIPEEARRTPDYARGYFDAEGGVPSQPRGRFYIQFVQKDFTDLNGVREVLLSEGIACGKVHNPSSRVDPDYWRFFVATASHAAFARRIGSWHPRKRSILSEFLSERSAT